MFFAPSFPWTTPRLAAHHPSRLICDLSFSLSGRTKVIQFVIIRERFEPAREDLRHPFDVVLVRVKLRCSSFLSLAVLFFAACVGT